MFYKILNVILISTFFVIAGCSEPTADIKDKKIYAHNGISFSYPGNWEVKEDAEIGWFRYILIETPGDAFIRIDIYANDGAFELKEYAEINIEDFKAELPGGFKLIEKSRLKETQTPVEGKTLNGYRYEYDLFIADYNMEVPHVQEYYMFKSETQSAYITTLVALEDLEKVQDGFAQILSDFKM